MIHYQLRCGTGHEFEGWFKGSAAFDKQAAHHLLSCPQCGSEDVGRALMAPALHSGGKRKGREAAAAAALAPHPGLPGSASRGEAASGASVNGNAPMNPAANLAANGGAPLGGPAGGMPDAMRAVLQRIRQDVEARCDDVGDRFAEEALRMHRGEAEERGIYGKATPEQHETLAEEGVEVFQMPWIPRSVA